MNAFLWVVQPCPQCRHTAQALDCLFSESPYLGVLSVPFSPGLEKGTSPASPSLCLSLSPAASGYGTQNIRLSRDAVKDFDCCCLSLQPCHDPVVT